MSHLTNLKRDSFDPPSICAKELCRDSRNATCAARTRSSSIRDQKEARTASNGVRQKPNEMTTRAFTLRRVYIRYTCGTGLSISMWTTMLRDDGSEVAFSCKMPQENLLLLPWWFLQARKCHARKPYRRDRQNMFQLFNSRYSGHMTEQRRLF